MDYEDLINEFRQLTIEICRDLDILAHIEGTQREGYSWNSKLWKDRPAVWFFVKGLKPIRPPIRFKIAYRLDTNREVYIKDLNRQATELIVDLNHPLSINKLKSIINHCEEKHESPKAESQSETNPNQEKL